MTSSSSSSGAMSNMSRLLASSRLSSYQPSVPQIYTAPPSYISRGDFGVKRPLPTSHLPIGKVRYIGITDLDTKYGQTEWREKEREVVLLKRFSELNIKLTSKERSDNSLDFDYTRERSEKNSVPLGSLGPKISTTYDPSTRRAVPTNYDAITNEEIKTYLQAEARLGRGPVYLDSLQGYADEGSIGRMSGYTENPDIRLNHRTMSENQFQKFLDEIRANRENFKDHLASRAAKNARARVAYQYEKERAKIVDEAQRAAATGATKVEVPESVLETNLPLPSRSGKDNDSGIKVDLWDEARLSDNSNSQWYPWLQIQNTSKIRSANNQMLPPLVNPKGGLQVPTPLHTHGGLQYGQPDSISTQLLHNSLPARLLGKALSSSNFVKVKAISSQHSVAIGGRIATLPYNLSYHARPIDISGHDKRSGNVQVKVVNATREPKKDFTEDLTFKRFAPSVDDQLRGLYGNTVLTVRASDQSDRTSLAKGIPGSTEWIARLDGLVHFSGQGNDSLLDISDVNALGSDTSTGTDSFWQAVVQGDRRKSELERYRRVKKARLSATSSSSKTKLDKFTKIFGSTNNNRLATGQQERRDRPSREHSDEEGSSS